MIWREAGDGLTSERTQSSSLGLSYVCAQHSALGRPGHPFLETSGPGWACEREGGAALMAIHGKQVPFAPA